MVLSIQFAPHISEIVGSVDDHTIIFILTQAGQVSSQFDKPWILPISV